MKWYWKAAFIVLVVFVFIQWFFLIDAREKLAKIQPTAERLHLETDFDDLGLADQIQRLRRDFSELDSRVERYRTTEREQR